MNRPQVAKALVGLARAASVLAFALEFSGNACHRIDLGHHWIGDPPS